MAGIVQGLECNDLETMRQASLINDVDAIIRVIEPDALEMLAIHVQSRIALIVKLDGTEIR